jgi:hypothetical protein
MKTKDRWVGIGVIGILTVVAAVLVATLAPAKARSATGPRTEQPSCYPNNDFSWTETKFGSGPFYGTSGGDFSGTGKAKNGNYIVKIEKWLSQESDAEILAVAQVEFSAHVSQAAGQNNYDNTVPGTMAGVANVQITGMTLGKNKGVPPADIAQAKDLMRPFKGRKIVFTSRCIVEAAMEPVNTVTKESSLELEYEGSLNWWPGYPNGTVGVVSIHGNTGPDGNILKFGLEQGSTCNEPEVNNPGASPNTTELGGQIEGPGVAVKNNGPAGGLESGRASLPTGVTPKPKPTAPCDGTVVLGET